MKPQLILNLHCGCVLTEFSDSTIDLIRDEADGECKLKSHFSVSGWPQITDARKAEILLDDR